MLQMCSIKLIDDKFQTSTHQNKNYNIHLRNKADTTDKNQVQQEKPSAFKRIKRTTKKRKENQLRFLVRMGKTETEKLRPQYSILCKFLTANVIAFILFVLLSIPTDIIERKNITIRSCCGDHL